MAARIYSPAKTAMQSGKAKTDGWTLEFEPEQPRKVEPLMGYTSSGDMKSQIRLSFETKEEAIAYAQKNGIAYSVQEPKETRRRVVSYSENFRFDRKQPWTH
ncbi:ETC complex I subunit [Phyllobacterium meliloti]|uniref:ETC complex I subunit n=1 Tax=Phyllobacterium meliloti TaxID=555317 RepID=UPI000DE19D84|nr:ETC complex I subunit [Phyllobacterium sp. T1293]UGX87806.1 ETC complex I subunit [Phyllobacterium sp. T1293]